MTQTTYYSVIRRMKECRIETKRNKSKTKGAVSESCQWTCSTSIVENTW